MRAFRFSVIRGVARVRPGIRPSDIPAFVVAQLLGASGATLLFRWLVPALPQVAEEK